MTTSINIYEGSMLIAALSGESRDTWLTARSVVNALAHDTRRTPIREWYRMPGRFGYERGGFRAVNTFRAAPVKSPDDGPEGFDDSGFDLEWTKAIREDADRRAAQLPARRRQRIPVVPTGGKP